MKFIRNYIIDPLLFAFLALAAVIIPVFIVFMFILGTVVFVIIIAGVI